MRFLVTGSVLLLAACAAQAQDMPLTQVLIPGEDWRQVKEFRDKPGTMTADRKGNVYVSAWNARGDVPRILRIGTEGKVDTFAKASDVVGGLAFSDDGTLYATLLLRSSIVSYDEKGEEKILFTDVPGHDLAVRGGKIYVTSPEKKAIFLAGRNEPVATGIAEPRGLVFWRKGGTLVVGEASGRHLDAYRIRKDRTLDARERYYPLRVPPREASAVRSLALDSAGRLYAATAQGVQIFDPTGRLSGVLNRPERDPVTALAFGGAERNQLFIVCGGKVWKRKTKVKGAP